MHAPVDMTYNQLPVAQKKEPHNEILTFILSRRTYIPLIGLLDQSPQFSLITLLRQDVL